MERRTRSGSRNTSKPATRAEPESGRDNVLRIFIVVDLPAPLGPSSAKIAPASTVKLSPSSARTLPPYVLTRSRASIAGAARPPFISVVVVVSAKESIIKNLLSLANGSHLHARRPLRLGSPRAADDLPESRPHLLRTPKLTRLLRRQFLETDLTPDCRADRLRL